MKSIHPSQTKNINLISPVTKRFLRLRWSGTFTSLISLDCDKKVSSEFKTKFLNAIIRMNWIVLKWKRIGMIKQYIVFLDMCLHILYMSTAGEVISKKIHTYIFNHFDKIAKNDQLKTFRLCCIWMHRTWVKLFDFSKRNSIKFNLDD